MMIKYVFPVARQNNHTTHQSFNFCHMLKSSCRKNYTESRIFTPLVTNSVADCYNLEQHNY